MAFSWRNLVHGDAIGFCVYAIAVFLGFLLHELAHRSVARRLGFFAYYRAWYPGLAMAIVISVATGGRLIVAAPGAVVVEWADPYSMSVIAMWGPLTNALIAMLTYPLTLLGGVVTGYAWIVGNVNAMLALFNALPIPPLDGHKVLSYSVKRWVALFATTIIPFILYAYTSP